LTALVFTHIAVDVNISLSLIDIVIKCCISLAAIVCVHVPVFVLSNVSLHVSVHLFLSSRLR